MGFRYRKSINLGGGFRINLSKSGVGYSWGVKGYRITKTAKGTTRRTTSIPGTGISYVEEKSTKEKTTNQQVSEPINNNYYNTEEITNSTASMMVSDGLEGLLSTARKSLKVNQIANIGICISLLLSFNNPAIIILLCLFVALKVYTKKNGLIDLDYDIDDDQKEVVAQRMEPMIKVTESNKVWRIMESSKVIDKKYTGGASNIIKRTSCKATQKLPFPFKTNIPVACFKTEKETLMFLPDKLFIIQGSEIGALNYSDITVSAHTKRFIEDESVPKDASIIDYTWKYVNKSGTPDKRFKNNKKFPICLYGEIELKSTSGLNTIIMFSNININQQTMTYNLQNKAE